MKRRGAAAGRRRSKAADEVKAACCRRARRSCYVATKNQTKRRKCNFEWCLTSSTLRVPSNYEKQASVGHWRQKARFLANTVRSSPKKSLDGGKVVHD